MRFVKWAVGFVALLAIVFFAGGFLLPKTSVVARSIDVNAPAEKVFPEVASLKAFNQWSPWAAMDKEMKIVFEGPESGVGQKMAWDSAKMGKGSETITEVVDNKKVVAALDFGFGTNAATFDLEPSGAGTKVTWTLASTHNSPMERWFGLVMGGYIGADFDTGLKSLKARVEAKG
jgi:hypothetical protein